VKICDHGHAAVTYCSDSDVCPVCDQIDLNEKYFKQLEAVEIKIEEYEDVQLNHNLIEMVLKKQIRDLKNQLENGENHE